MRVVRKREIDLVNLLQSLGWEEFLKQLFKIPRDSLARWKFFSIAHGGVCDWKYLLDLPKDARILELGCGLGASTFSLAQSAKDVYALSDDEEFIKFIKARLDNEGKNNSMIVPMPFNPNRPLDFANEEFDVVVLNFAILFSKSVYNKKKQENLRQNVLAEGLRVLKKAGIFVILDRKPFFVFSKLKDYYCSRYPILVKRITEVYSLYPDVNNVVLIFPQHCRKLFNDVASFGFQHICGNTSSRSNFFISVFNILRPFPFFTRGLMVKGCKLVGR